MKIFKKILIFIFVGFLQNTLYAQPEKPLAVSVDSKGLLQYARDDKGNRIPDFSYCGYAAAAKEIPVVPAAIFVPNSHDNAGSEIQRAIDYISSLQVDKNGWRGAILLDTGTYYLPDRLRITHSGIVIRGQGMGEKGTTLIASGTSRETLIKIIGENVPGNPVSISIDAYVPVNGMAIALKNPEVFSPGDRVLVSRPVVQAWVDTLKMNEFGGETSWLGWKPGRNNIEWHRSVVAVNDSAVLLDAPITTAIDPEFGGGFISAYNTEGHINNIGIEHLNLSSDFNQENPKDEAHCWMAISIENAIDCWVRQVHFSRFAGSAVAIYNTASQVTVEDCISQEPVSEIGGQRRYTFFTSGQLCLFQRCYSEYGYHDFAVGNFAAGPNAFVQCEAHLPYSFSGTIDRWASAVLFDLVNIDGNALSLKNREAEAQGAGWTAANSMLWQCTASKIECYSPPTATNYAYGAWGQFSGNGEWYEANSHIKPRSLYYQQLSQRMGKESALRAFFQPIKFGSTSSPDTRLARELTNNARATTVQLKEWIALAPERTPLPVSSAGVMKISDIAHSIKTSDQAKNTIRLQHGWLMDANGVATGKKLNIQWWRGNTRPFAVSRTGPHLTRFVPGRTGQGLTDDLAEVAEFMHTKNFISIDHNYGLWYERRRDDHERIRRMDPDVWAPFYELPFARSGKGTAWDGLSKYDLNSPNTWYWNRLKKFADIADQKGLLLIHQNYFQHNILEAGAHFADFPWRTANNINHTGFPEPPPYAGDKRIFMAEQFYDLGNENRKRLHRQYIRQCLVNFEHNSNVIQLISEEFTGPLHFVEFWIDVISDWEIETGKNPFIGLSTTKDVQDAILSDPRRSRVIDLIDIKYWHYREDGPLYAPPGDQNLAPRQHARLVKPGTVSFASVYRAVAEYKLKYPEKAVIYSNSAAPEIQWAVFMAGGSLAALPRVSLPAFYKSASTMLPVIDAKKEHYVLRANNGEQIIYWKGKGKVPVDVSRVDGAFTLAWINPENGKITSNAETMTGGKKYKIKPPYNGNVVLYIIKN